MLLPTGVLRIRVIRVQVQDVAEGRPQRTVREILWRRYTTISPPPFLAWSILLIWTPYLFDGPLCAARPT